VLKKKKRSLSKNVSSTIPSDQSTSRCVPIGSGTNASKKQTYKRTERSSKIKLIKKKKKGTREISANQIPGEKGRHKIKTEAIENSEHNEDGLLTTRLVKKGGSCNMEASNSVLFHPKGSNKLKKNHSV